MTRRDFQSDIRELNLTYLMLAQQMLLDDRETAMFRLGIDGELADLIKGLSGQRLIKLASCQMLLPTFRFDDAFVAGLLAGDGRDPVSASLHGAIIAAGKSDTSLRKGGRNEE